MTQLFCVAPAIMKARKRFICVIVMVLLKLQPGDLLAPESCSSEESSVGKEFIFGLIEDYLYDGGSYPMTDVLVTITSKTSGQVWVRAPAVGIDMNYSLTYGYRTFPVSRRIIQTSNNTVERKSVHLLSDVDISVYVMYYGAYNYDGFLALPINKSQVKQTYIITSAPPVDNRHSQLIIAAMKKSTTISISLPKQFNVVPFTVNLDMYETYLYKQSTDLSGTIIESSEPVSVIAGTALTRIFPDPSTSNYGSFVVEQMPSTVYFSHTFIVPTIPGQKQFMIKVFTDVPRASLEIYNSSGLFAFVIGNSTSLQTNNVNEPVFLTSDKRILVVQYGFDYILDFTGSEFMMVLPSISNFMTRYDFYIPVAIQSNFTNYLCVVSTSTGFDNIYFDSSPLSMVNLTSINTTEGNFTVSTTIVPPGKHTVISKGESSAFGAVLYGMFPHDYYGFSIHSYGFPLGMRTSNECSKSTTTLNPSSQSPAKTTQTTVSTVTAPVASTTTTSHSNYTGSGITCFECQDVTHLYLCNTLRTCHVSEKCFIKKTKASNGFASYQTGCMDQDSCPRRKTGGKIRSLALSVECMECCNGSFCNSQGCGGQGLPERNSRGPMCFDCQHVEVVDECNMVKLCLHDEVCSIQEFEWGDTYRHYSLGCAPKFQCTSSKRSNSVCENCCYEDYCNTNCTRTMSSVQIIG